MHIDNWRCADSISPATSLSTRCPRYLHPCCSSSCGSSEQIGIGVTVGGAHARVCALWTRDGSLVSVSLRLVSSGMGSPGCDMCSSSSSISGLIRDRVARMVIMRSHAELLIRH